jgi:TPR repeat protein
LQLISIASAITLTEWSESTFRRRISDGALTRHIEPGPSGRAMVDLDAIKNYTCIPLEDEDSALIKDADTGNAEAQNDLALLFLANSKLRAAIYWLELAAKQDYPDAMHWLGRCHIDGNGVLQDENLGMMWLAKAAAHGHAISQAQMQSMLVRFTNKAE